MTAMEAAHLAATAAALTADDKGILAADERESTLAPRFAAVGLESTPELRRAYREMLLSTPGAERYIGGVILYDETIRQATADGTPFPRLLSERGIIPGIKVDAGTTSLAHAPAETITQGLDGLRERLAEYRSLGARFAKWRATYSIASDHPSEYCIWTNAHALARYAALCQEAGLVPIVEPEVLQNGDHTIQRSLHVTSLVLRAVFTELFDQRVDVAGMLLKPNMVLSGYDAADRAGHEEVAEQTLTCLYRHVPAAVPGVVFLSGGQTDEDATRNLSVMNASGPHPWAISFSYGRALQSAALRAWAGRPENVADGQQAFLRRARLNSMARAGTYAPALEDTVAA